MDDEHTLHFQLSYEPGDEPIDPRADLPVEYRAAYKAPPDALYPIARFTMDSVLRTLTREQIERVRQGQDPMGVWREPRDLIVDTNFSESVKAERSVPPSQLLADTIAAQVPVGAAD